MGNAQRNSGFESPSGPDVFGLEELLAFSAPTVQVPLGVRAIPVRDGPKYHSLMRFVLFLISCVAMAGDFSTALGDQYPYAISAITTDPAGSTYVVGSRQIGVGAFTIGAIAGNPTATNTTNYGVGSDVFVSKLDPNGKLIFTDTFGGKGNDVGTAIAVDPAGNIYIAGFTSSTDFPLSKALQTQPGNGNTGFVMKLSNDGSTILYSTFFGGTLGVSAATSLATDAQGNLYLTGTTTSADFPHTTGMPFGPNRLVSGNTAVFMSSVSAAGWSKNSFFRRAHLRADSHWATSERSLGQSVGSGRRSRRFRQRLLRGQPG